MKKNLLFATAFAGLAFSSVAQNVEKMKAIETNKRLVEANEDLASVAAPEDFNAYVAMSGFGVSFEGPYSQLIYPDSINAVTFFSDGPSRRVVSSKQVGMMVDPQFTFFQLSGLTAFNEHTTYQVTGGSFYYNYRMVNQDVQDRVVVKYYNETVTNSITQSSLGGTINYASIPVNAVPAATDTIVLSVLDTTEELTSSDMISTLSTPLQVAAGERVAMIVEFLPGSDWELTDTIGDPNTEVKHNRFGIRYYQTDGSESVASIDDDGIHTYGLSEFMFNTIFNDGSNYHLAPQNWLYKDDEPAITFYLMGVNLEALNVSTEDKVALDLSIFPNPANNVVNVNVTEQATANIYAITGELVKSVQVNAGTNVLDVADLTAGVYMIEVANELVSSTQRLVITK